MKKNKMMKLVATLALVVLATVARADQDFYSASAPQYDRPQYTSSYSNYYDQSPPSGGSFLSGLFGNTRRQGLGGLTGGIGGPLIAGVVVVGIAIFLLSAAALVSASSSGRGLDTDDWEVDHSVWMSQLQKDFEDSWSTE